MIGPANPNPPCCSSCGVEGPEESFTLYRLDLVCAGCREEHDAAGEREAAWDSFEDRNRALPAGEQRD